MLTAVPDETKLSILGPFVCYPDSRRVGDEKGLVVGYQQSLGRQLTGSSRDRFIQAGLPSLGNSLVDEADDACPSVRVTGSCSRLSLMGEDAPPACILLLRYGQFDQLRRLPMP